MENLSGYPAVTSVAAIALGGYTGSTADRSGVEGATRGAGFKTCAVSDTGGWDDKSFNESAHEGLEAAKNNFGVKINTAESSLDTDFVPNVEAMVNDGCDFVIGVGFKIERAPHQPVEANTDIKYAPADSSFSDIDFNTVIIENGQPLFFNTADAALLTGYVTIGMTKTGKVVISGGIQILSVLVFMDGLADGVAAYNKTRGTDVQLLGRDKAAQNGSFTQSFDDQTPGKQQTQQFIDRDADITIPVVDPVGPGAVAAAEENGSTLIIGVDSDWYDANPNYSSIILISVMKQIGAPVEQTIKDSAEGKFSSESYIDPFINGGTSLAPFHDFGAQVSQEFKGEVEKLNEQVKNDELRIESQNSPK